MKSVTEVLWDTVYNFNGIINHILIKIMALSFRQGIQNDPCQSSQGPICMGNHDQANRREDPEEPLSPDCLLFPKHWPDISCTQGQDQTEAKSHCLFHGDSEINFNQITFLLSRFFMLTKAHNQLRRKNIIWTTKWLANKTASCPSFPVLYKTISSSPLAVRIHQMNHTESQTHLCEIP